MKEKIKEFLLETFPEDLVEKDGEIYVGHLLVSIEKTTTIQLEMECNEITIIVRDLDEVDKETIRIFIQRQIFILKIYQTIYQVDQKAFVHVNRKGNVQMGHLFFGQHFRPFTIQMNPISQNLWMFSMEIGVKDDDLQNTFHTGSLKEMEEEVLTRLSKKLKSYKLKSLFNVPKVPVSIWFPRVMGFQSGLQIKLENVNLEEVEKTFYEYCKNKFPRQIPELKIKSVWEGEPFYMNDITIERTTRKYSIRKEV